MEGVKNLEMQRRRTLRRRGSGAIGAIGRVDLGTGETPSGLEATPAVTVLISGTPVKWSGKPDWGVGGAHSTDDGKDNITLPEGRSPALLMCRTRVRVGECLYG
jgi:hypothetical protein